MWSLGCISCWMYTKNIGCKAGVLGRALGKFGPSLCLPFCLIQRTRIEGLGLTVGAHGLGLDTDFGASCFVGDGECCIDTRLFLNSLDGCYVRALLTLEYVAWLHERCLCCRGCMSRTPFRGVPSSTDP